MSLKFTAEVFHLKFFKCRVLIKRIIPVNLLLMLNVGFYPCSNDWKIFKMMDDLLYQLIFSATVGETTFFYQFVHFFL